MQERSKLDYMNDQFIDAETNQGDDASPDQNIDQHIEEKEEYNFPSVHRVHPSSAIVHWLCFLIKTQSALCRLVILIRIAEPMKQTAIGVTLGSKCISSIESVVSVHECHRENEPSSCLKRTQ